MLITTKIIRAARRSRLTVATLASLVYIAGLTGLAVFLDSGSIDTRQIAMLIALPMICVTSVALGLIWKRTDR